MGQRKTPMERMMDGETVDRRRRYDEKMKLSGFIRVTVLVPEASADKVRKLADKERLAVLKKGQTK